MIEIVGTNAPFISHDIDNVLQFMIYMMPLLFYDLYMEYLLNGQTPGKKLMKIRVIRLDGEKPKLENYAIRWAFRIVENFFVLVGAIPISSYLLTKRCQRIGDLAAGTTVIKISEELFYSSSMLREKTENYKPFFADTSWATRQDIQLMYHLLHRVFTKQPAKEGAMLRQIAEKLREKYLEENPASGVEDLKDITDTKLVRIFAFDFNYYEAIGGSEPQLPNERNRGRYQRQNIRPIASEAHV